MRVPRFIPMLAAAAILVAACSGSATTTGPGGMPPNGASQGPTLPGGVSFPPIAGGGACDVNVTGDTTVSWHSPQTVGSVLLSYWLGPAELAVLSLKSGESYFLMNCTSATGDITLSSAVGTLATQFVHGPGTYVIAAGGLLGGAKAGQISTLVTFRDHTLWKVAEAGTLNVTTFNSSHFAGTFTMKIGKTGSDLQTIVATATVSGIFDMACMSRGCS
jgi:hypothetical protein